MLVSKFRASRRWLNTKLTSLAFSLLIALLPMAIQAQDSNKSMVEDDWGDWQQTLMDIDIYTLPLSPQQHEILQQKINSLKQKFGVGITVEIEQAIIQMDNSNILDEPQLQSTTKTEQQIKPSTSRPLIRDDLMLEEEILALEFADSIKGKDPEGLNRPAQYDPDLFNKILQQLEQLEQNALKKKGQTK